MKFSERVTTWRDRSPRQAAMFIAALLVVILTLDGFRLHASRRVIPHSDWNYALGVGLGFGVVLLAIGGALWLLARRYPAARRPIEITCAIAFLFIFGTTHHRGGPESIKEPWQVTYVVAGALLLSATLIYATAYRWTRGPTAPSADGSVGDE